MANFLEFIKGSVEEMRRVTWSEKTEVILATTAVAIFVVVFSSILFGVDILARLGLQELLR